MDENEDNPDVKSHARLFDQLWPGLEPPADFSRRVVTALNKTTEYPALRTARPGRGLVLGGVFGACAAAAVAVFFLVRHHTPEGSAADVAGDLRAVERQSVRLGERGVAVAEAGAEFSWSVRKNGAHVDQRRGSVFYRVEHGGPFVVVTDVAEVEVTGTCFQVEVETAAGAPRAEPATALVVRVFEGGVRVGNEIGRAAVRAGQRVRVRLGEAPGIVSGGTFDRSEVARDLSGAAREAAAQARVRDLERALAEARRAADLDPSTELPRDKFFDFTPDERRLMGQKCRFRYSLPEHLAALELPEFKTDLSLTSEQRAAIVRVMQAQRAGYVEELRSIFIEVVGDRAAAETLSPMALQHEITSKSTKQEEGDARRRLYKEWTGQSGVPNNLASRPAIERYWRLQMRVADDFFHGISDIVGPEQARVIGRQRGNQFVDISGDCESKMSR
jgi:hypothetical protein